MEFTFNVTVGIYDDDIDEMVENVREKGWDIDRAMEDVLVGYDDFEWSLRGCYWDELRKEVERRLEEK